MAWIKRKLRGNSVFVRVDASGEPEKNEKGLVSIIYKLRADAKVYHASWKNLGVTGDPADERPFESDDTPIAGAQAGASTRTAKQEASAPSSDAIIIYTDGACSQNPGPMGLGAVVINRGKREELSEFLGIGTNNIAELTAISRALDVVPAADRAREVVVHTDSSYCIGVLGKGWKAKANQELITSIRAQLAEFSALRFVKVKGHAGIPENERCDELATDAVSRAR